MKVSWQTPAKEGRRKVAAYIRKEFGTKRVKNSKQEVDDMVHMLMRTPNIGKLDPLFEDRPQAYRSVIINGLNKMVYRVEDDIIYIVGFWDTRMDDENQAVQVK